MSVNDDDARIVEALGGIRDRLEHIYSEGSTPRERFACAAMASAIARGALEDESYASIAETSFAMADAMVKEL